MEGAAMPIKPGKDESQSDWMGRCVPEMMAGGKREQDQAVAACAQMWRGRSVVIYAPAGATLDLSMNPDTVVKSWSTLTTKSGDEGGDLRIPKGGAAPAGTDG